jgi:hypothetical protein
LPVAASAPSIRPQVKQPADVLDVHRRGRVGMVGYYVQVRYPHQPVWVTIDVTESRRAAAAIAGRALRHHANSRGVTPTQVRVIATADLVRQGGQEAINRAAVDLWQRETKTSLVDGG